MNKYLLMLSAAALIAAAPVYYAFNAQAEDAPAVQDDAAAVEITVDCTKATLDGEEVPADCKVVEEDTAPTADAAE